MSNGKGRLEYCACASPRSDMKTHPEFEGGPWKKPDILNKQGVRLAVKIGKFWTRL